MTKFSFKLKKPYFWPVSGPFPQFFWKKSCPKKSGMYHAEIQRNPMIQFQENNPTDSRMEGWIDHIS